MAGFLNSETFKPDNVSRSIHAFLTDLGFDDDMIRGLTSVKIDGATKDVEVCCEYGDRLPKSRAVFRFWFDGDYFGEAEEVKPIHIVSRENVVKYHVERYYDGQIKAVELFKELLAAKQLYDLSWSHIDGAIMETEDSINVDTGSIVYSFIAYSQGH